jgi:photosystem II stability/assembly factor-like uncharacterized protein
VRAGRPVSGSQRIHALKLMQLDKLVLFAGTDAGLFRSANAGMTWAQVKSPGMSDVPVLAIYAPPRGAARMAVETRSGLFVSEDGGGTWRAAFLPDSSYYIYDVALSIDRDAPILAATSRGVLQSVDGGDHWRLVSEGVPSSTVESVRFHPEQPLEAYLVQYGKVFQSLDGGTSWQPFPSDGLENSSVRRLWLAPGLPGRIFALSAARGALVFDLAQQNLTARADEVVSSKDQ